MLLKRLRLQLHPHPNPNPTKLLAPLVPSQAALFPTPFASQKDVFYFVQANFLWLCVFPKPQLMRDFDRVGEEGRFACRRRTTVPQSGHTSQHDRAFNVHYSEVVLYRC